jgi:superfamily II DNA or RNA helicase
MDLSDPQKSRLVLNHPPDQRVLDTLATELKDCERFRFYVAFVTTSGVASLKQHLLNALDRGAEGRVLVSQYQNFSHPEALAQLLKLPDIDLRIATQGSMHAKGYFFSRELKERLVIGSSNWTDAALSEHTELNVLIETDEDGDLAREVREEFDIQFQKATPVTEEFVREYRAIWKSRDLFMQSTSVDAAEKRGPIEPNKMQVEALQRLDALRSEGQDKALVVSATGTGKTYLAAFDAKQVGVRRLLFVVHRENIARESMESFKRIHGDRYTYGMYTGWERAPAADFVFSTVQTLSRPNRLEVFAPEHFDYIVVDESHRAGAQTYSRFLRHFKPQFLLGMTATPERTDGKDIFQSFDYNTAYEIRLHGALKEKMLCPFHYYGIQDVTVDGKVVEDETAFDLLVTEERVRRIIEKLRLYGCYDGIPRGLIFCSRVQEAQELSHLFNRSGLPSVALTGNDAPEKREKAIERLEGDDPEIHYIFTVDVFNEGVDIPLVNQIVMLRPTKSPIIFVQQLGRGMRKVDDRDKYLTVIDFIGNYENNYMIPMALYGDRSADKDRIRRLLQGKNREIPGTSTVNFDRISQKKIFESINSVRLNRLTALREEYRALKSRLGRVPMMVDFLDLGLRDPRAFAAKSRSSKSYFGFARDMEDGEIGQISVESEKILESLAKDALNGRTCTEPILLDTLLNDGRVSLGRLEEVLAEKVGLQLSQGVIENSRQSLNLRFLREGTHRVNVGEKLGFELVSREGKDLFLSPEFRKLLDQETFLEFLRDSVSFSLKMFLDGLDPEDFVDGFVRYRKYSRADVLKILGWPENPPALNVGGYIRSPDRKSCPIFVTYDKDDEIAETIQYGDKFKAPNRLHWFSKSKRRIDSPDVRFITDVRHDQRLPLFVKKSDDEGSAHYYLGELSPDQDSIEQAQMPGTNDEVVDVVRMDLLLDQPVESALYQYLIE